MNKGKNPVGMTFSYTIENKNKKKSINDEPIKNNVRPRNKTQD